MKILIREASFVDSIQLDLSSLEALDLNIEDQVLGLP
jgi:hypothetical protein